MASKVSRHASSNRTEKVFFNAFQKLLKQRQRIDSRILKMQGKLSRVLRKKSKGMTGRKVYVSRLKNTVNLQSAILESMVPEEEMTMQDILESLQKNGLYHTKSGYFYTMVNNKLHKLVSLKKIKKTGRGVFTLAKKDEKKVA